MPPSAFLACKRWRHFPEAKLRVGCESRSSCHLVPSFSPSHLTPRRLWTNLVSWQFTSLERVPNLAFRGSLPSARDMKDEASYLRGKGRSARHSRGSRRSRTRKATHVRLSGASHSLKSFERRRHSPPTRTSASSP